jgi:hypothetical protein
LQLATRTLDNLDNSDRNYCGDGSDITNGDGGHTSDTGRNNIGSGDGGGVNGDDNDSNDGDNNDNSNVGDGSSGGDCNNGGDGDDSGDHHRGIQNINVELMDIEIEHFLLRTLKNKVTFGLSGEETLVQLRTVFQFVS